MRNRFLNRAQRGLMRRGRRSIAGAVIGTVGSFVINDLKKEDSVIKGVINRFLSSKSCEVNKAIIEELEEGKEYRVVNDINKE